MTDFNYAESISLDEILSKTRNGRILGEKFWEEHYINEKIQWEMLENYPDTFIREFPWINACEDVIIEMIQTRRPKFLDAVLKKDLTQPEQLALIEFAPERVKDYQGDSSRLDEANPFILTEEAEKAYLKARELNPELAEIPLYWN